jgi:hypothetical protein
MIRLTESSTGKHDSHSVVKGYQKMLHLHRDGSGECRQGGVWKTIVDRYPTSKCFSQPAPIKREKPKRTGNIESAMAQETSKDLQESQASRIEILWLSKNKTIYDPEIGLKKVARSENIRSNTDPLLKRNGKLDIEAKSRVSHARRDSRQGETSTVP